MTKAVEPPVIVVTRDVANSAHSLGLLRARGVTARAIPLIAVEVNDGPGGISSASSLIDGAAWVLFTSANAVEVVTHSLGAEALAGKKVAVVGPATAGAARDAGIDVTVEGTAGGAALAEALLVHGPSSAVFIGAVRARRELIELLETNGWQTSFVGAYVTKEITEGVDTAALFSATVVTFASPSAVRAFASLVARDHPTSIPMLVAIGETTKAALTEAGLACAGTATTSTARALVDAAIDVAHTSIA